MRCGRCNCFVGTHQEFLIHKEGHKRVNLLTGKGGDPVTINKRRDRTGPPLEKDKVKQWHLYRDTLDILRKDFNHTLGTVAVRLDRDRNYIRSAYLYPYQLTEKTLGDILKLLDEERSALPIMPKKGAILGPRLTPAENRSMRRLVITMRNRGIPTSEMARTVDVDPSRISTWLNDPNQSITTMTKDRILSYMRSHVTGAEDLIREAFELTHTANGATPGVEAALSAAQPEQPEVGQTLAPPSKPRTRRASNSGLPTTFDDVRETLQRARDGLVEMMQGMPKTARDSIEKNIIEFIDSALREF